MSLSPHVIVVGAGPTGLTLAAELADAGIRCHVLEKRRQQPRLSKAFTIEPRTMELLDMRGRVEPFLEYGKPCPHPPMGDKGRHLDYNLLDTPFPYSLIIPQHRTEQLLEACAIRSGAVVRRGVEAIGLRQDEHVVELDVRDDSGQTTTEQAQIVIGSDGANSTIRAALDIEFQGWSYEQSVIMADAQIHNPPESGAFARITKRGMVAAFPFRDGTYRIIVFDHERMMAPADLPLDLDELSASCAAILGVDIGPHDPLWMSRFRSSQRHARQYRSGRVLLVGDAAHTHIPSGGQGLQTGIQDAMNLGWKLAAELNGWAPAGLLDSYQEERYPIAAATLRKTDLSFRYETSNSLVAMLLRRAVMRLMRIRPLQVVNLQHLAGLALRYPAGPPDQGGRWVGRRAPDSGLREGPHGCSRALELFRNQQFVLLECAQPDGPVGRRVVEDGWTDRVQCAELAPSDTRRWPRMTLIRPDGYVAWAQTRRAAGLRTALYRWCGEPAASTGTRGASCY